MNDRKRERERRKQLVQIEKETEQLHPVQIERQREQAGWVGGALIVMLMSQLRKRPAGSKKLFS